MAETVVDHGTCRCGSKADKTSSGVPECWKCWNRRKLDLPAARYWGQRASDVLERNERLLENLDIYDIMTYLPACGLSKEEMEFLATTLNKTLPDLLNKIVAHSVKIIENKE